MGSVKLFGEWDWAGAGARNEAERAKELKEAYREAMEINTNYGDGHHFYCGFLEAVGEADQSVVEIKRAMELDPLSAMLTYELGLSYYIERKYDDALAVADYLNKPGSENNMYPYLLRATVLEQKGRYDEAIDILTKGRSSVGDAAPLLTELGYSFGKRGKAQEARNVISDLQKRAATEFIEPMISPSYISAWARLTRQFHCLTRPFQPTQLMLFFSMSSQNSMS